MTKVGDDVLVKGGLGYPSKAEVLAIDGDDVTVRMSGTGRRKIVPSSKIQGFRGEAETVIPPTPKTREERREALRGLQPLQPLEPLTPLEPLRILERLTDPPYPMLAPLRAVPKPKKAVRSARYLAFVREKKCCSCGAPGPSDPHHYGSSGMGQKTDDLRCVPLCRRCHDCFHDHRELPNMSVAATRFFLLAKQVDLLVEFLRCELESP